MTNQTLLSVDNLTIRYKPMDKPTVDTVSFDICKGQVLGVVGESGCGKTTLARTIMGALPSAGVVEAGNAYFCEENLLDMDKRSKRAMQGCNIGMITQQSLSSLNPVRKIGAQFVRLLGEKLGLCRSDSIKAASDFLRRVSCPEDILNRYPFQLSGGQRQRVLIAMAFALKPKLLIADEPTTALDVSVQAQVLEEIMRLKNDYGTAIMLISHNFGIVSQICDDIAVMYRGVIVEYGNTKTVLSEPSHSYTKGLIGSIPHLDIDRNKRLYSIPEHLASHDCCGCTFAPRCTSCDDKCTSVRPSLLPNKKGVLAACWR